MKLGTAALVGVILSITLVLAGALVITFTALGIVGFVLIMLGICFEIYAVTRPRRAT
jgi:hypothetical protein